METISQLISERVDAVPLLINLMTDKLAYSILDDLCPPHGNWEGLSIGQVMITWLARILSERSHTMSHVQDSVDGNFLAFKTDGNAARR
jgi:hypothetical protein